MGGRKRKRSQLTERQKDRDPEEGAGKEIQIRERAGEKGQDTGMGRSQECGRKGERLRAV